MEDEDMSKFGDDLILGMENALAYARSEKPAARETVVPVTVPDTVDVRAIRRKLGCTQADFALRFGFKLQSIRNWEQGARQPEGPARVLLMVIDRRPDAVQEALSANDDVAPMAAIAYGP
jgi:putative transcriptional regulator